MKQQPDQKQGFRDGQLRALGPDWAQVRRSYSHPCHGGLAPQATDCERS